MSGHSKWSKIKRQKEVGDQKRSQLFTKLARAITVATKQGEPNPEMNFKLRLAINRARSANMPKDNIERAIKRGSDDGNSNQFEEIIYEGFGPEKVSLIIEVLTDNRNRSVSEIKHLLTKAGGSLAGQGAVMWQFDKRGLISCQAKKLDEKAETAIINSGALDYSSDSDTLEIITQPDELEQVKKSLEKNNFVIESSELVYLPKEKVIIKNNDAWQKFQDELNDLEDVNEFYTNAEE